MPYPRFIHARDMVHSSVWHDSFIHVTWLIHIRDMAHPYMWHDSLIYVTWLIHMCHMTLPYVSHDAFICVTRLIHTCDMAHLYVWHGWFTHVTRLIHMQFSFRAWHAFNLHILSFIRVTWRIHTYDMTSYVRHDAFTCMTGHVFMCAVLGLCAMAYIHVIYGIYLYDVL